MTSDALFVANLHASNTITNEITVSAVTTEKTALRNACPPGWSRR